MHLRQLVTSLVLRVGLHSIPTYGQVVVTWTDRSGDENYAANWNANPSLRNNRCGTSYNAVIKGTRDFNQAPATDKNVF